MNALKPARRRTDQPPEPPEPPPFFQTNIGKLIAAPLLVAMFMGVGAFFWHQVFDNSTTNAKQDQALNDRDEAKRDMIAQRNRELDTDTADIRELRNEMFNLAQSCGHPIPPSR